MILETPLLEEKRNAQQTVVIILLGPPGSGKGTQANMLSENMKIPHISTGNLLRLHIEKDTLLGKKAKLYMDQGELVPDDLILDILFDRINQKDCKKGYILDGFPRTLSQAQIYHNRLISPQKIIAINLELKDELIIDRLSKRLVCVKCSATYHITHSPPIQSKTCNNCKSALIQRSDDKEIVIRHRLKVFHEQTATLINHYSQKDIVHKISCTHSIEGVLHKILGILKKISNSIEKDK